MKEYIDTWWKADSTLGQNLRLYHIIGLGDDSDMCSFSENPPYEEWVDLRKNEQMGPTLLVNAHIINPDGVRIGNPSLGDASDLTAMMHCTYRTNLEKFIKSIEKGSFSRVTKEEALICLM